ncbi:Translationally-controlled tumor protein-like protein [Smittium culicis]|uniref:Translationally-controlled tumor protein homolog n=1 Tax=Smittium culicis TaxID=133412 RepID=A0A1R1YF04_9FUNG|nr:Translationally-controlled tumor protein-like protein [Smittium culicis]
MLLYRDALSGDELFSDAFPMKEVADFFYEVDCKMITVGGDNIDIGANPSAEDGEEIMEDGVETVNNVVHSFRLTTTSFDKKSYMSYIKGYMKAIGKHISEKNPERLAAFQELAKVHVKNIITNFSDYDFYVGESMDPEGMVALLNYREDGVTPFFTFFKDGLKAEKL